MQFKRARESRLAGRAAGLDSLPSARNRNSCGAVFHAHGRRIIGEIDNVVGSWHKGEGQRLATFNETVRQRKNIDLRRVHALREFNCSIQKSKIYTVARSAA